MRLLQQARSNPLAWWWGLLTLTGSANIAFWFLLYRQFHDRPAGALGSASSIQPMLLLCAAYVFGCAFRSFLPRADVQRICLFDTWLSSVFVGRSVATVAEICFVVQWAIVLRQLGRLTNSDTVRNISTIIVPLILTAEICSWYAVVTTSYLGNTIENSLWAVSFLLVAAALLRLLREFSGPVQLAMGSVFVGLAGYVVFMGTVDVPMYFGRWQEDVASGKQLLGLFSGLRDLGTRWVVTHDIAQWRDEIAWMSLYFSVAVWSSLGLCALGLVHDRLPHYRAGARRSRRADRPLPARREHRLKTARLDAPRYAARRSGSP